MTEMMYANLDGRVEGVGPLRFVRAEWWSPNSRFVLLRYSISERMADLGLRMDLDKKVILDHLDDRELDEAVQQRALNIWDVVAHQVARQRREQVGAIA